MKKSTPIQRKLMRVILLTCGTVLAMTCAAFFVYEFITYRNITKKELSVLGQIVSTNITSSIAFVDNNDANEILASLKAEKHVIAAAVYDKNGKLFAHYPVASSPKELPSLVEKDGYRFKGNFIEGFEPVTQEGVRLGTLYLKSDLKAVYERFILYGAIAALFIVISFVFAYLLSKRLQRSISDPILELANTAKIISERGDYSVRANKRTNDEVGTLTDAFNHMLTQIHKQNAEINELNANLEEKIVIRTYELQEANVALKEQNKFIETIIDSSIDLIAVFDTNLHYLTVNKYAAEIFGRKKEEMVGRHILEVFPNLEGKPIIDNLQRALAGEFIHVEAYKSQVSESHFENFFIPLKNEEGNIDRVLLVGHDITSIIVANEKLREVNTELEKSNLDLEQFAYVASHDLQEPLRKIRTFSELSLMHMHNQEILKRYLDKINSSAGRMSDLIKAVLNYSRLSRMEAEFNDVDLNMVVSQLKTDLELSIEEKKAKIVFDNLPVVKAVPLQMNQLFLNLFSNSLKFCDKEPVITISSQIIKADEADGKIGLNKQQLYARIVFSDNGIGFEQKYAGKAFSIFQRLHSSDQYSGTGIGLALCKKIIDRHSGHISVQSTPGEGTSFFIYLPIATGSKEQEGNTTSSTHRVQINEA